jgi:hypothetical protein
MTDGMAANPQGMLDGAGHLIDPGQMAKDLIEAHDSRMADVASWWGTDDPIALAFEGQYVGAKETFLTMGQALIDGFGATASATVDLAKQLHLTEQLNADTARRLTQGHG